VLSRIDTSTAHDNPFDGIEGERTTPLSASSLQAVKDRVPEGRRETGEVSIEAVPTGTTRNERPRALALSNPWAESEQTVPLGPGMELPKPKRDLVATAEIDREGEGALGSGEVAPTAVSTSGARDVEVGELFKPLVPTLMGADSVPEIDAVKRPSRPGPPVPELRPSDSIPEISSVSVVSAGEATQGVFVDRPTEDEPSQPSEPSEPSPVPSTRAPPRVPTRPLPRPPPQNRRPPKPGDPDDDIETVDQAHEFSVTQQSNSRKVAIAIIGVAVLMVVVFLAAVFWPASEPGKPKPPGSGKPSVTNPEQPQPTPTPTPKFEGVRVQIRAVKGTLLSLDGKPVSPEEVLQVQPGELVLKFTCPPKKRVKSPPGTLRAQIPDSEQLVVVEVPCK
jgi:hypothetical protein